MHRMVIFVLTLLVSWNICIYLLNMQAGDFKDQLKIVLRFTMENIYTKYNLNHKYLKFCS